MLDINTAANIAEIAGGVAILISLLYVGYQIRQSNRWDQSAVSLTPTIVEVIETYLKDNPQAPSLMQLYPQQYGEIKQEP